MKISNDTINELASKLVSRYNPYVADSNMYSTLSGDEYYLYHNELYTKEQLDGLYIDVAVKDIKSGYNDRIVGYYDKWYRYNRADEGNAYDEGVKYATTFDECVESMRIIPA